MRLIVVLVLGLCSFAQAQTLQLTGDQRWATLASRQKLDEAIGVARAYGATKVVAAKNGWFAVIAGPYTVKSEAKERKRLLTETNFPRDFLFSKGDNYTGIAWQLQNIPSLAKGTMDEGKPIELKYKDLVVSATTKKESDEVAVPVIIGKIDGKTVFEMVFEDGYKADPSADIDILQLDPTTPQPQVMLSTYTGGAHCCYELRIATANSDGTWSIVKHDPVDGGPPAAEIIDGLSVLVQDDQRFKYTYASYAESLAPSQLYQLRGKELKNISYDPRFIPYYRQQLAGIDFQAVQEPSLRQSFGFMGAWFATKVLAREAQDGLALLKASYNKMTDWNDERCLDTNIDIEKCAPRRKVKLKFPDLVVFDLKRWGYPMP